jgi:dTDP-4-amino-4,6-dideoxygalactose transaminase
LTKLDTLVANRRRIASLYSERLSAVSGVIAPSESAYGRTNWQSYCVQLTSDRHQKDVMQFMLDSGISTRRGIMNSHLEAPYAGTQRSLPNSERAQRCGIVLPLPPQMTAEDVDRVCHGLDEALRRFPA